MAATIRQVENYLGRLGIGVINAKTVDLRDLLPLSMASAYHAVLCEIRNEPCIVLFPVREGMTPGEVIVHNRGVADALKARPLFALSRIDKEMANCLMSASVSFIVPSRFAFVPPSIVVESDRAYAEEEERLGAHLSPWAQVVLLDCLLHERLPGIVRFAVLRERLGIKPVYLSRSARELERRGALRILHSSKEGELEFGVAKWRIWDGLKSIFASPVRRTFRMLEFPKAPVFSGMSALSRYSDLTPDDFATVAVVSSEAKTVKETQVRHYDGNLVEVWRYNPRLLSSDGKIVDPLSLCLSMGGNVDPRVQSALESLLGKTLC